MVVPESRFNKMQRTLVVPFTSKRIAQHMQSRNGVLFEAGTDTFITQQSVVPAEWMDWIPTSFLDNRIEKLSSNDVNRVLGGIANFLGIPTYMDSE